MTDILNPRSPWTAQAYSREAEALRTLRRSRRAPVDVLAVRERKMDFWRTCPWYAGRPVTCASIYRNNTFRRLLLPKLAAMLAARKAAWKAERNAQLAAEAAAWEHQKAEKKAAKTRKAQPVADWIDEATP